MSRIPIKVLIVYRAQPGRASDGWERRVEARRG